MKPLHTCILLAGILLSSCSSPESGAIELSSLSKKVFDTLKSGDSKKFTLLIPDEISFERYTELANRDSEINLGGVTEFQNAIVNQFQSFRKELPDMSESSHANYSEEQSKYENITRAVVTTKFTTNGAVTKYNFDAVKLNGRWYCIGNFAIKLPESAK